MNQQEAMLEIGKRIIPQLQEFGVEGFVIAGYARFDGAKLERFVGGMAPKDNAAIGDGLSKLAAFGTVWAAPEPQPPFPPR